MFDEGRAESEFKDKKSSCGLFGVLKTLYGFCRRLNKKNAVGDKMGIAEKGLVTEDYHL